MCSVCLPETLCVCVLCFCSAEHVPTSSGSLQTTFFQFICVRKSHNKTEAGMFWFAMFVSAACFISFGLMCWHKYSASKGFDGADVLKCHGRFVGLNY